MEETHGIGWAVEQMQAGKRVCRSGWNGKGMWLTLVQPEQWSTSVGPGVHSITNPHRLPWVGMKTADGGFVPWLCSQTDLLATDWQTAE